jgi:N-acetylglucosamine transport system substrate-binding protein
MKTNLLALGLALCGAGAILAGCSGGSGNATPAGGGNGKDLDVVSFQGGFGIEFFQKAAKEYEAKHPGTHIKVTGGPRVWEQLRPRFASGNPPSLTWPGWGMDYWALIYDNQVFALNDALKTPAFDGKGTWGDTFDPSLLKLGEYHGKQYELPYHYNIMGWWYNPDVFAKHGWTVPKTFNELLALGPKIKAAGMAPLTFQGQYPDYTIKGFLFPWVISVGGIKAADDAQSLVPGAWKSEAFLQAAKMIKQVRDAGFFEDGASGLSHTESQTDFLQGKAAMIPCGTWLESEMRKTMPPGAKMQFMMPPVVDGGKGDPSAIMIGIEPWIIPTAGSNHELAIDFYKYMTSVDKAKEFVTDCGTLTAIKGSDQVKLPPVLEEPVKFYRASKTVYSIQFDTWYSTLGTESKNAMAALLNGSITPEEFVNRLEAAAEKVRQDKSKPVHIMTH